MHACMRFIMESSITRILEDLQINILVITIVRQLTSMNSGCHNTSRDIDILSALRASTDNKWLHGLLLAVISEMDTVEVFYLY